MCMNVLNSSELSAAARYERSWNESMCTLLLGSASEGSWKESVCVATLLIALIPAVLSVLYGDVLLYLWLLSLCLGCIGDGLLGSMVNSLLLGSMVIPPLSMGVSLDRLVLMGSMVDSPLLCSMGISSLSMGVSWTAGDSWAVCLPAAWLCIAGVGSLWSCMSCSLWVLFPFYSWVLVWNET